jgi:hypothetical protein
MMYESMLCKVALVCASIFFSQLGETSEENTNDTK